MEAEALMSEQRKLAVERALRALGRHDEASQKVVSLLWDQAFEEGRLAALDELQDRFCVCMK